MFVCLHCAVKKQQQQPTDPNNAPGSYGGDSRHHQAGGTGYPDYHRRPDHNGAGPAGYHGNHPDYYQNQGHAYHGQGDSPGSTPPHVSGKWVGPEDQGRNYFGGSGGGDNYYQGQRGRGFSRGRGRGGFPPWKRGWFF